MRQIALVLALALPCAAIVLPTTAHAQLTTQDHERARGQLAEGRNKRAAGDHKGALDHFRAAHEIEHLPTTGIEVGRELIAIGRLVEAREMLTEIAKTPTNAGEPPPLAAARTDARDLVDALERRIPTLTIKLSRPAGASTTAVVDGFPIALDLIEKPRRLDPGEHIVILKAADGTEEKQLVKLSEGESKEITITPPNAPIPIGPKAPPQMTPLAPAPPDEPAPSHMLAYFAGGIALVSLGIGIPTGLVASSKTSELEPLCPNNRCPPDQSDNLASANTFAAVSTISFVTVGVCGALVLYDLLRTPSRGTTAYSSPPPLFGTLSR